MSKVYEPGITIIRKSPYSDEIIENLKPFAVIKNVTPNRKLFYTKNAVQVCYLILEGQICVERSHDGPTFAVINSPALLGMRGLISTLPKEYLQTITPCSIGIVSIEKAEEVIREKELWEALSKHMMFTSMGLNVYSIQLSAPTAYEIIRYQLYELMSESEKYRGNITAESYIRSKTYLSRSRIMKVLSDLKAGGYIEMRSGVLYGIKELPKTY